MRNTPPSSRFIITNRPHGEPRRHRAKGQVMLMEGGAVSVHTRTERNGSVYFDVSPVLVLDMISAMCPDANGALLEQVLAEYGVDTPKTLARHLLQNFYVFPHMQVQDEQTPAPAE